MAKSYRFDRATIHAVESSDGFLRGRVKLARTGVFPYLTKDGKIRMEAKLPDELFSKATIASANGAPVTDGHPRDGLVRTDNYQELVRGSVSSVEQDGSFLVGLDTIYDDRLRADILAGKKVEVSIGFEQELDETPGVFGGKRYDAVQRNIRINHIAHVEQGRAGESVRIELDSDMDFAVMQDREIEAGGKMSNQEKTKTFRTDDGRDIQVPEALHSEFMKQKEVIDALRKDAKESDAKVKDLEDRLSSLEKQTTNPEGRSGSKDSEVKKLEARLDALAQENEALKKSVSADALESVVRKRLELHKKAERLLPSVTFDGLSDREIKLKVIETYLPFKEGVRVDEVDDVRIDAQFEAAADLAATRASQGLLVRSDAPKGIETRQNLFMGGLDK